MPKSVPGVIGVLTPDDVVALSNPIGNLLPGPAGKLPYYPCAVGRVRYFGEPVAVVVAEDRYIAEDALDLIDVRYAERPAVIEPDAAMAADAPIVHEALGTNVAHERDFHYGDPEGAFARAYRVVSHTVWYPRVNSTPIETYGVIADYDAGNRGYTVWSNFQGPYALHPIMCGALRVRGHDLRLISAPSSGGSFGIKQGVFSYVLLMALASRAFRRPVKWIEDRLEHLAGSSASSGRISKIEGAFDREGLLLGLRLEQTENVGAYVRPPEPAGLYRMHTTLSGPYRVRHMAVRNRVVLTNQVPSGLNRGYGGPQFYFPLERMMDKAARGLGPPPSCGGRLRVVAPAAHRRWPCARCGDCNRRKARGWSAMRGMGVPSPPLTHAVPAGASGNLRGLPRVPVASPSPCGSFRRWRPTPRAFRPC